VATRSVVRFGVIGAGQIGRHHCGCIKRVREAKLVAVCDPDPQKRAPLAAEYRVPPLADHKALLRGGLADAVIVCTPHTLHAPIAIDCMKAGRHVLCEKPLAETVSAADRMVRAAARTGVAFGIMFQRRTEPAIAKAIELVRSGRLGRLHRAILISPEYRPQAYFDAVDWRATWRGEGGGVLMNQAPHILDVFLQLTGMPATVVGRVDRRLHDIETEDVAEAMLTFPEGATGYVHCSTAEPGPGQVIELAGDKGKLTFRDGELHFYEYEMPLTRHTAARRTGPWDRPGVKDVPLRIPQRGAGHHVIIRNFARHILRGEPLISPGRDGVASLELANAILLSSELGEPVRLPLKRRQYDALLSAKRAVVTKRRPRKRR
jgi:UDP-N-acetyl-2-amino-2-deoxyglucuronate dehydrogenase